MNAQNRFKQAVILDAVNNGMKHPMAVQEVEKSFDKVVNEFVVTVEPENPLDEPFTTTVTSEQLFACANDHTYIWGEEGLYKCDSSLPLANYNAELVKERL